MEGEWVNLLRTPEKRPNWRKTGPERRSAGVVKVLENTPQERVGVKKGKRSEVQVLRSQVAVLAKEKQELSVAAKASEELLNSARQELEAALQVNSQAKAEMEDQRRVVHRLSADNARLIRQVEMLWQHSPVKSPSLPNHTPSPRDHTHSNDVLVKDLERLSQRTTELSQALGTTQQARTALEREVVSLKRSQLELQTSRSQLEEALARSEEERASLSRQLQEVEGSGRRQLEQLQIQMDTALSDKTAKLEELLGLSERLQSTLTTLSKEKDLLECSLRQEVASNHQLALEKAGLAEQVEEMESTLTRTKEELSQLQDHQLREVEEMKGLLENEVASLQQDRELLSQQLQEAREEKEALEREMEATRGELEEGEREVERLTHDVSLLQTTLTQSERDRATEHSLLTSQLAEATAKCQQLQREVEEVRGHCERRAVEQVDSLTSQLRESASHLEEVDRERTLLQARLREMEGLLSHQRQSHQTEVEQLKKRLESVSHDLSSAHSDLKSTQMANADLSQQVSELDSQVSALNEQVSGRIELTNEMRALLEQRANQIQQLETIVQQQREELLSASHTHLYSNDSTHIMQATPIMSLLLQATPPSAENSSLRKQLSESRQTSARLEAQCEEMRTEVAKLQGSVQALTTIRDQLTEENNSLLEGRRRAEEGKRLLSQQLSSAQTTISNLRSRLAAIQGEREEVMSRVSELEEAYIQREMELTALEEQSVAASEQCETGEVEREYLQLELAKARMMNAELEGHVEGLQQLVERERTQLHEETERCSHDLSTLRQEAVQVQENCCITAAVNAKQTNQIAEKEGRVSQLLGEVEVLRARKAVVMRWLCEREGTDGGEEVLEENRRLHSELDSARAQLQHCLATHAKEMESLTQRLRETEEELAVVRREGGEDLCRGGRGRGRGGCGEGGRCRLERRVERLREKLKGQVEQSNYLRVKLGYTLKELQLYKELKARLDQQLTQQGSEMMALQESYEECLNQLRQVEQLGFQGAAVARGTFSGPLHYQQSSPV